MSVDPGRATGYGRTMGRRIARIVSGGQTGADRAALDAAIALGIPYAGWCPRGGWAEDLPEPPGLLARYPCLRETPSADPGGRTAWNVRDSDATLILTSADASASLGTASTIEAARSRGRPLAVVDVSLPAASARVAAFLGSLPAGATLNVAGPRESEAPGIERLSRRTLLAVLAPAPEDDLAS